MKKSAISDESKALHKMFRDGVIDHETLEDSMDGLALLPPPEAALAVYSKPNGLDPYLDSVKDKIDEFKANPPSLETASGRAEYKSMARKVASFKTALDSMGKELVDELKDVPKKVDAERKRIRELLDCWRDDVRKPVDDWEAEQKAIEEKRLAEIAARELQEQVDRDHELAVYQYADYLRAQEEAAKQAVIDAENAAKAQKEREEEIAKEAAENARLHQQQQSEQAAAKAKQDAIDAAKKAEEDKQKAIEAERQRVENERLEAERKQQELEKNRAYVGKKRKEAKESLMAICGLSEDAAKAIVLAIAGGKISNVEINY